MLSVCNLSFSPVVPLYLNIKLLINYVKNNNSYLRIHHLLPGLLKSISKHVLSLATVLQTAIMLQTYTKIVSRASGETECNK